jgi:D-arabinose 1-dehydrogenase-like Zn-dependent alcohol dehydrogenase
LKAAFYEGNEVIRIGECIPAEGEVRIRISHCGICGTDLHVFHGAMDHRVTKPAIIGHEMSGVIESVGAGASFIFQITVFQFPLRTLQLCAFRCLVSRKGAKAQSSQRRIPGKTVTYFLRRMKHAGLVKKELEVEGAAIGESQNKTGETALPRGRQ